MLPLSEIYIFSTRADVLAFKTYRHEGISNTRAVFTKRLKDLKHGHLPPHFEESGVSYYYIKRSNVYFVGTSHQEASAVLVVEFLSRLYHVCKDFCGTISEDSVLANILLIQELLDEIMVIPYKGDSIKSVEDKIPLHVVAGVVSMSEYVKTCFIYTSEVIPNGKGMSITYNR